MKYVSFSIRFISAFVILFVCLLMFQLRPYTSQTTVTNASEPVPTVFIHGFKGSARSFNPMLDRFQYQYHWGSKTMICYVKRNGEIIVSGTIPPSSAHPFIQVIFENNRARIDQTSEWLQKVMFMLHNQYHVTQINAVGHSMGGLDLVSYLEKTYQKPNYPAVRKLITIGSPFEGIPSPAYYQKPQNYGPATIDLNVHSTFLTHLLENKNRFNPQINVLSIAGVIATNQVGDGVVPLDSALGLQHIAKQNQYQWTVIRDIHAYHSGLHEHRKVDAAIGKFLWNENIDIINN